MFDKMLGDEDSAFGHCTVRKITKSHCWANKTWQMTGSK